MTLSNDRVPEELRVKGLRYCREFLGGAWKKASMADFTMQHIRGGLSNLLYCCKLSESIASVGDEPRSILLRLYGQIICDDPETILKDSVIFAVLAEKKLGPRLHGVFMEGRLEEYVPSRHLKTSELHDPEISKACGRIMAQFHKLQIPINKEPKWLFDVILRYLDEALNHVRFDDDEVKQSKLQQILDLNLPEEFKCLREMTHKVHSPVVFCHNDLQEGNILFVETPSSWHVRPIDFEYASYNYRGFDIGNHFCEWCYNYESSEPPFYIARFQDYPSREQQLRFIRAYLEPSKSFENGVSDSNEAHCNGGLHGTDAEENMLVEINVFALASHFMWALWGIVQSHISSIEFGYLEYALERLTGYFKHKELVLRLLAEREKEAVDGIDISSATTASIAKTKHSLSSGDNKSSG